MNKKNACIVFGVFSFIMMIGGLMGYLYHTDCCGLKAKCNEMKGKCCSWKSKCCCQEEEL